MLLNAFLPRVLGLLDYILPEIIRRNQAPKALTQAELDQLFLGPRFMMAERCATQVGKS